MFVAYQGEPNNLGETVLSQPELNDLVARGVENELDIHFHALGERAISYSLDAIEAAKKQRPETESRFTLSHIQVMGDEDKARHAQVAFFVCGAWVIWADKRVEREVPRCPVLHPPAPVSRAGRQPEAGSVPGYPGPKRGSKG